MVEKTGNKNIEKIRFPSLGSLIMLEGEFSPAVQTQSPYGAILCHPHPEYGGNMNNIIISKIRDAFQTLGIATLRFNFRGTGLSEGEYDNGKGEVFDVAGASKYLIDRGISSEHHILVGYSFGAAVTANFLTSHEERLCYIGIALPTLYKEYFYTEAEIKTDTLLLVGSRDDISSLTDAKKIIRFSNVEEFSVEGGDHLFTGTDSRSGKSRISVLTEHIIDYVTNKTKLNTPEK